MVEINNKLLGGILIGLSVILIIILVAVKYQQDKEGAFLCKMVAADPKLTMDECPAHDTTRSWLIMAAFGVAMVMLVTGGVLLFKTAEPAKSPPKESAKTVDVSKLDDEEKALVALLQEHEGSMYQSDIVKNTGHSKVHTTRLLDKLEGKNLVERRRRGMSNIVLLK